MELQLRKGKLEKTSIRIEILLKGYSNVGVRFIPVPIMNVQNLQIWFIE